MPAQPLTQSQKADAERLKRLFSRWQAERRKDGLPTSQEVVGGMLDLTQSGLSQYLNGRIPLNVAIVVKLASLLGCQPEEISPAIAEEIRALTSLTDAGNTHSHISASAESTKTGQNRGLFEESTEAAGNSIDATDKLKNVAAPPPEHRLIPVLTYMQAGKMIEVADPYSLGGVSATVSTHLELSGRAFGLLIEGDSMLPEYREGELVVIDPEETPFPGEMVLALVRGETVFRKYRETGTDAKGVLNFELVPLNDDFPTLHSERDHMQVIGVMVEHRKYRRRTR
jgi:SOS-response transcriptional repressor LexA